MPRFLKDEGLAFHRDRIARYLKKLHFKPRFFGGVDEADVWKRIEELNRMYEEALQAERDRYDRILRQYAEDPLGSDPMIWDSPEGGGV